MYNSIISMIIHENAHTYSLNNGTSSSTCTCCNFFHLIQFLSDFLKKIYATSLLLDSGDYSSVSSESLNYIFLKLYKRNINLSEILNKYDTFNKFYIPKNEFLSILVNTCQYSLPSLWE